MEEKAQVLTEETAVCERWRRIGVEILEIVPELLYPFLLDKVEDGGILRLLQALIHKAGRADIPPSSHMLNPACFYLLTFLKLPG